MFVSFAAWLASCGGGGGDRFSEVLSAEFSDFDSGRTMTLTEFEGEPIVVNLWSSTCPSCIHEMPDFETVSQELRGEVTFIGINVDADRGAAEELAAKTGVTYQLGVDDDLMFSVLLEVISMPTTAFITADGEVAEVRGGQLSAEALREQIAEHLLGGSETAAGHTEIADAVGTAGETFEPAALALEPGLFPALHDPVFVPASAATWLDPDDIVMGAVADSGETQAYPVDQMAYHHIANTKLAGEPFLVTY
jgi:thiol-disulfide isomerase/thioredoxin